MAPARVAQPARIARSLTTDVFELILARIMREQGATLSPSPALPRGGADYIPLPPAGGEGQGGGERTTRNASAEHPT